MQRKRTEEEWAWHLVNKYHTADPWKLTEAMSVDIQWVNFDDNEKLGFTNWLGDQPIIMLKRELKGTRGAIRVLAHELGHVVLHKGINMYYHNALNGEQKSEAEANRFMMGLLTYYYHEEEGRLPDTLHELTAEYGVSNFIG